MKKLFPILLIVLGVAFMGAGTYTVFRGLDAKDQVHDELIAQQIRTTPDAARPNILVKDASSAKVMADVIDKHMRESTNGKTYSELDRFLAKGGGTTSDAAKAQLNAAGKPTPNPLRDVAFQASTLRTSLFTSIMAFNVAELVMGLGLMIIVLGLAVGGVGVALGGLAIPALARRVHVDPIVAKTA